MRLDSVNVEFVVKMSNNPFLVTVILKWGRVSHTFPEIDVRKEVRYIKDSIRSLTNIEPHRQKLLYRGRVLVVSHISSEYCSPIISFR